MARPVTLFTGQWADLPLADLAGRAAAWGYDGLELACWGDHFDVAAALADPGYAKERRALLERHGLRCLALGAHLVGQAVCDPIDERHRRILPAEVWGDGDPEGVRRRAAARLADTARAAGLARGHAGQRLHRLADLAPALLVPAERLRRDRAWLRGGRRAVRPDPRRLRGGGRPVRSRGASDRDRLRLRHDPEASRRARPARVASGSTSTRATSPTNSSTRPRSRASSATASTTSI